MTTTLTPPPAPTTNFDPRQCSEEHLEEMLRDIRREALEIHRKISENYRIPGGSPAARDALRSQLFPLYDRWNAIEKDLERRHI